MTDRISPLLLGVLALALVLALCGGTFAQRDRSMRDVAQYPIVGDDGQRVSNHSVAKELADAIERLPGIVVVGNPRGTVSLAEFYDLNCPYCRIAAGDISDIVETDAEFRLVLVPFPVLGVPSIQAGRIELAVAKLGSAEQFYDFHRKIYSQRGVVDAARALEVARSLKLDEQKLIALADSDDITESMKAHVRLGNALGIAATPGFVIQGVAVLGYPGRRTLQGIVDSASRCGKVLC
jgi:protein-disulfide isomerase